MTNQIEIDVETTYLSSESKPEENKYYFLYTVLIYNSNKLKFFVLFFAVFEKNSKCVSTSGQLSRPLTGLKW